MNWSIHHVTLQTHDVKKSAAYSAYRNRIWDSLREEVLKAREEFP